MAIKKLPSTGDAPRSTGVPASLVPGGDADSAGFPWQGRTFTHHDTAFAGDSGDTPSVWTEALAAVRAARENRDALAAAIAAAIRTLSTVRVLVPLLAEAGEIGVTPDGRQVDKSQELSIVTVRAPDGRRALPAFTSVATMRDWHPDARPIPVPGPQAALAAAQDGTDLIIIDPGNPDREFGVRRTQREAMALGQTVVPGWADREVQRAFRESAAADPRVIAIDLRPGDPESRLLAPETDVIVHLAPGLEREEVAAVLDALQRRWAASDVIAERVDSLRVAPVAAG